MGKKFRAYDDEYDFDAYDRRNKFKNRREKKRRKSEYQDHAFDPDE